jgi:hypothetical protein
MKCALFTPVGGGKTTYTCVNWLAVNVVVPLIAPTAASMVVCPDPTPLATPVVLIVATVGADELQLAVSVRFCVLPSL